MTYLLQHCVNSIMAVFLFHFFHFIPIETIVHPHQLSKNKSAVTNCLVIVGSARRDFGVPLVIGGLAEDVTKVGRERNTIFVDRGVGLEVAFDNRAESRISCRERILGSVRLYRS